MSNVMYINWCIDCQSEIDDDNNCHCSTEDRKEDDGQPGTS